jgi:hypothetical protein
MVDNSTNISSTNNHLSHQIIEHEKNRTNDVENPGPGLERAQNVVFPDPAENNKFHFTIFISCFMLVTFLLYENNFTLYIHYIIDFIM